MLQRWKEEQATGKGLGGRSRHQTHEGGEGHRLGVGGEEGETRGGRAGSADTR